MTTLTDDDALRVLLAEDPPRAWRMFIDQYTPTLLALIERAAITDRDEAMELYVRVCERLADDDCARLRRRDPGRGALASWLAVVVRHVVVDWVRTRAGRRRLFGSVKRLEPFDQRTFELYYWEGRTPAEIAELLSTVSRRRVTIGEVLSAVDRIEQSLTERQRSELLSLAARSRPPVRLETESGEPIVEPLDERADPETKARVAELDARFAAALGALPAEDAAILRLRYVQSLTRREIEVALNLGELTENRMQRIMARLRRELAQREVGAAEAATRGLGFLEGGSE